MSRKKSLNVSVKRDKRTNTNQQLVRKFLKKCKEENVVENYKRKTTYHKTKRQKARDKKAAARLRSIRRQKKRGY